jgi:hypothetical protein
MTNAVHGSARSARSKLRVCGERPKIPAYVLVRFVIHVSGLDKGEDGVS